MRLKPMYIFLSRNHIFGNISALEIRDDYLEGEITNNNSRTEEASEPPTPPGSSIPQEQPSCVPSASSAPDLVNNTKQGVLKSELAGVKLRSAASYKDNKVGQQGTSIAPQSSPTSTKTDNFL